MVEYSDESWQVIGKQKCFIVVKVIDKGIGMTADEIANAFNLFWCSEDTSSKNLNPTGNGVGLYICKQICEGLGGNITVKPNHADGAGCEFIFSMKAFLVDESQSRIQELNHRILPDSRPQSADLVRFKGLIFDFKVSRVNAINPEVYTDDDVNFRIFLGMLNV